MKNLKKSINIILLFSLFIPYLNLPIETNNQGKVFGSTQGASDLLITNVNPSVAAGGIFRLMATGGTGPYIWSLSPGSSGSINPVTGEYSAPARVAVNHQAGGCQVYPSASIFSTKISNLPTHQNSTEWINTITPSAKRLVLDPNFGLNIINNSTPLFSVFNYYTPSANGSYPIESFPSLKREGGYYSHQQSGLDRHIANVNKETCEFTEMYNTYPVGSVPECPTCSSQSSARYFGTNFKYQVGDGVDAAGLPLQPVTLNLAEMNAGVIKHPMRFTLPNNIILPNHIWPATAHALAGGGKIPYGAWLRLKSSYNISGFSPKAKIVLQAWKDYGLFMADGGLTLEVTTDGDVSQDKDVLAAISEISNSGPQIGTDFEFIDASSLMVNSDSTEVKHDNPYETPIDFAHVCVTDSAMAKTCKYIALQGVTVGTTYAAMTFQAGSGSVQLDSWVHGSANKTVNWSMNPVVGNLTSGGLYTPPNTVSVPTKVQFIGTSAADPNAKVYVHVIVWPEGIIRIDNGSTTDYVGSEGVWFAEQGFDGGHGSRTNEYSYWRAQPDIALYHTMRYIYSNDLQYRWWLNPGNYKITLKWGIWNPTNSSLYLSNGGKIPENNWVMALDTNGQVIRQRYDVGKAQGIFNQTHDLEIPCWVKGSDKGLCFLAIRQIADKYNDPNKAVCLAGGSTAAACAPGISAIRIEPDTQGKRIEIDGDTSDIITSKTRQFKCVGWFMSNNCSWSVVSGPGSIDANGLYTAPSVPSSGVKTIKILAVSSEDSSKTAQVSFNFVSGTIDVTSTHEVLSRGQSATFTASIGGVNYSNVLWSHSGTQGFIDSNTGVFQAPAIIYQNETITVTATSKDDPTKIGTKTFLLTKFIDPIRINSGGNYPFQNFTDGLGRKWSLDNGASGGMTGDVPLTTLVTGNAGGADPEVSGMPILYQSHRYVYSGGNSFSYAIPVPSGSYSVRLKFMPPAQVSYVQNVIVEDSVWRTNWDVIAASGGVNKAVDLSGTVSVLDGTLNITIRSTSNGAALLNGIEVLDQGLTSMTPTPNPQLPPQVIDNTAPIISNITTSKITDTSATITWTTDEPSSSQLEYGLTSSYGASSAVDGTPVTTHTMIFSNLTPGTKYNYRVISEDLVGNERVSSNQIFTTQAAPVITTPSPTTTTSSTFSNWSSKKSLTINKSQVQGSHTNFPVLISFIDQDLRSTTNSGKVAKTDGTDIFFTTTNDTKLSHEIEKYDPTTGELIAWVKVPSISSANDTTLNLYFGNSTASDQQDKTGVWDANYRGVWHLNEGDSTSAGYYKDSTSNSNNASLVDSDGDTLQTSYLGGAIDLSGDSDYLSVSNGRKDSRLTFSFWFKPDDSVLEGILNTAEIQGSSTHDRDFYMDSNSKLVFRTYDGGAKFVRTTTSVNVGTWYYASGVYDGTNNKIYLNGMNEANTAAGDPYTGYDTPEFVMGNLFTDTSETGLSDPFYDGSLDEIRVSNAVRSADWIKTEYNNQSNPSSFISLSGTQTVTTEAPVIKETAGPVAPSGGGGSPSVTFSNTPSVVYSSSGSGGGTTGIKTTNTTTNTTSVGGAGISLPRDLVSGAKGSDVVTLQNALISMGYLSAGNNTGFYGPLTIAAVKKYQQDKGLGSPGDRGWGNVGPKTRASLSNFNSPATTNTLTPTQKAAIQAQINSLLLLVNKLVIQLKALQAQGR